MCSAVFALSKEGLVNFEGMAEEDEGGLPASGCVASISNKEGHIREKYLYVCEEMSRLDIVLHS